MASNKSAILKYKKNNGYVAIYPYTTEGQVLGWNIGELKGPYNITLNVDKWDNIKSQTISLNGVTSNDIIYCTIIYSQDKNQRALEYNNFKLITKIDSKQNGIKFTCSETPSVDLTLQVWWTK